MASRNRKWNEWERTEFTTRGSDPTVVVTWTYRYKDGDGTTRTVAIEEFQAVYSFEIDGTRVDAPAHGAWEQVHRSLEAKFEAEQEAVWALQHPDKCPECGGTLGDNGCVTVGCGGGECEHGYTDGCRGCDPDGR